MNVFVNNKQHDVSPDCTLSKLLAELCLAEAKGIAVAVDNQIVFRQNWESKQLSENQNITIIKATQGG